MRTPLELLKELEPYLDSLICYASTVSEYPINGVVQEILQILKASDSVAIPAAEPVAQPHCIAQLDMGHGRVVVVECTLNDVDAIAIYPSMYQGEPGKSAKREPKPTDPEIARQAIFLTFPDALQRDAVADALVTPTAQRTDAAIPIGYMAAYELDRLNSGHDASLRSAKFGPSALDGDVPVFIAARPASSAQPVMTTGLQSILDIVPPGHRDANEEELEIAKGIARLLLKDAQGEKK